jgi:adenylylsulfate kinase-like enzyme
MTTYVERGRELRADYIRNLGVRRRQRRAEARKLGRTAVVVAAFSVLALAASFTSFKHSDRHASASISPTEMTLQAGGPSDSGLFDAH